MSERRSATVIGAGVVGLSCALYLQRDDWRVSVIDPKEPASGASHGNAGVLSFAHVTPVGAPGVLRKLPAMLSDPMSPLALRARHAPRMIGWFARFALASRPARVAAIAEANAALSRRARAAHEQVAQWCGAGELLRSRNYLEISRDAESFERAAASKMRMLERAGFEFEVLDERSLYEVEPHLGPGFRRGLRTLASMSCVDPGGYGAKMAERLVALGGRLVKEQAVGFERTPSGAIGAIDTDRSRIETDLVVLAAGAHSKALAKQLGWAPPLDSERGYHAILPHPEQTLSGPVIDMDRYVVCAPMAMGLRVSTGAELAGIEAPPDWSRIDRFLPIAAEILPGLAIEKPISRWYGRRPSMPDSLPVIGAAPGAPNAWFAFGHGHVGFTQGPLTGRLIADLVGGRDPGLDMTPYRPGRLAA